MPRPKIDAYYESKIRHYVEQGKRSPEITQLIKEEGKEDSPSESTVRRIYQAHISEPASERIDYRIFQWPDSMQEAGLPWEASRVVLDFIQFLDHNLADQPTIGLVKWYWRVYQGAPDMHNKRRIELALAAKILAERELHGSPVNEVLARAVETFLAYQGTGYENDLHLVQKMLQRHGGGDSRIGQPPYFPKLYDFVLEIIKVAGLDNSREFLTLERWVGDLHDVSG